jgi:hypothetical protein
MMEAPADQSAGRIKWFVDRLIKIMVRIGQTVDELSVSTVGVEQEPMGDAHAAQNTGLEVVYVS